MTRRRRNPRIKPKTALLIGGLLVAGLAGYSYIQSHQTPPPAGWPNLSGSDAPPFNGDGTVWQDPQGFGTGAEAPHTAFTASTTIIPGLADLWKNPLPAPTPTTGSTGHSSLIPGIWWGGPDTGHSGLI